MIAVLKLIEDEPTGDVYTAGIRCFVLIVVCNQCQTSCSVKQINKPGWDLKQ